MKRKFFIILSLIALLLSACVPATEVETKAPSTELQTTTTPSTSLQPTNTPQYLSPLYKTHIFVGGEGWATNLDNTKIYNTVNFGVLVQCHSGRCQQFFWLRAKCCCFPEWTFRLAL